MRAVGAESAHLAGHFQLRGANLQLRRANFQLRRANLQLSGAKLFQLPGSKLFQLPGSKLFQLAGLYFRGVELERVTLDTAPTLPLALSAKARVGEHQPDVDRHSAHRVRSAHPADRG